MFFHSPNMFEYSRLGRSGATIKHPKHHVIPSFVDDTSDIAVIHGGCNNLGYKNNEALSTDDIVNAILVIGKLYQSHSVKDTFISSLICRKNNFQNNKNNMLNNLLRSACDSLGFHFIDNSSITHITTWLVMGYI